MARLRNAPTLQQPAPTKPTTRKALKEKTNTTGVGAPSENVFKDFVRDARPTRGRAKKPAQNEDDFVMAGGLGQRSDAPQSEAPRTTDELAKSDGPAPPTAKASRQPPRQARKPAQSEAQSKVLEDMKKRMQATAQKEAASDQKRVNAPTSGHAGPSSDALPTKPPPARNSSITAGERSEFSISPSPSPRGKLSAVKNKRSSIVRPDSVLKSQSTPAAETSVLALKNFKRRPRQPSMLAMVQQRAAGARPSVSHVQQATEFEPESPSVFDVDGSDEDEEDFAPEAEGTPLHLRKAKRASSASKRVASPMPSKRSSVRMEVRPNKRKSDDANTSSSSLSALRSKRQKLTLPADADEPVALDDGLAEPEPRISSDRQETPQPQIMSEVQVINSSPSTTPPTEPSSKSRKQWSPNAEVVVPSTEEQHEQLRGRKVQLKDDGDEEILPNETMAEPMSSSPPPDGPVATQSTDIMAEPLTQNTPPRPKRAEEKTKKKTQRVTTSTLQSLLPKRRQVLQPRRRKSEYDIDSESDEDNAGEGGDSSDDNAGARSRRRTKTGTNDAQKSKAKSKTSNASRKSTAPTRNNRKSSAPSSRKKTNAATSKKGSTKNTKTYGRNAASDKENDPTNSDFEELSDNDDSALPDMSLTVHDVAQQSGELAAAKAKFAEVDGWDMEFESVSFEEGRSSSQAWR